MVSRHCRPCGKDPHRLPDIPIYIEDQKAAEKNAVIRCDIELDEKRHL